MPAALQLLSQISSSGTPRIGARHFGILSVIGRNRVPFPAARMKAFINYCASVDTVVVAPANFRFHCHADSTISRSAECFGCQPSSRIMRFGLAHNTGGSPSRRALVHKGIVRLVT